MSLNSYAAYVTMVSMISIVTIITLTAIVMSKKKKIPSLTRTPNAIWVFHVLVFSTIQSMHRFYGVLDGPTFIFSTWGAIVMLHGLFSILFITIIGMRVGR